MKIYQDTLTTKGMTFELFIENTTPSVNYEGKTYQRLIPLLNQVPIEPLLKQPNVLAKLVNHLFSGMRYRVIESPEKFQERYAKQIEKEGESDLQDRRRISDYGVYDISKVVSPTIQDKNLIFYAEDVSTGTPYRVSLRIPPRKGQDVCHYDLLPEVPA